MTISPEFKKALEIAAKQIPGPRVIPWPSPGMLGGFVSFSSFTEWQRVIVGFQLPAGVPRNMADLFDRALKLYLAAWLDFDLITAAEMASLSALEHSLRDCYLGEFHAQHMKKMVARAKSEKREPRLNENFRPESISLNSLLQYMHQRDGLSDDQLPCVRKYGGSILRLLNGETNPGLADMRNVRAHGNPFGSGYQSGLLEVVHDLLEYAYRSSISQAQAAAIAPSSVRAS